MPPKGSPKQRRKVKEMEKLLNHPLADGILTPASSLRITGIRGQDAFYQISHQAAVTAERIRCAKIVCERCRLGVELSEGGTHHKVHGLNGPGSESMVWRQAAQIWNP